MLNAKWEALKDFLIESGEANADELPDDVNAVYNENYETFEVIGNEYKVFTDEEADEAAAENIKECLWAFNADFILQHSTAYEGTTDREDEIIAKALQEMQSKLCESAQPIVKALIKNLGEFTEDAIDEDGRGHFLATYDGEENESGSFYIYRTN
jgi:hypothetical protein